MLALIFANTFQIAKLRLTINSHYTVCISECPYGHDRTCPDKHNFYPNIFSSGSCATCTKMSLL